MKTHYLGSLANDVSLVTLYSAVDVMIVPSLQENLSNAIMESLACGTPVVGFDIGGNSDMLIHKKNGYLAIKGDVTDFIRGIEWVLNTKNPQQISDNAQMKIKNNFSIENVIPKYYELYKTIAK